MTNMMNFTAQQLTKKQMNEVKGGTYKMSCIILTKNDQLLDLGVMQTEDHFSDEAYLQSQFPDDTVECTPWLI